MWRYFSGAVVCIVSLVLPFRARMLFAKILNYVANPPKQSAKVLLKKPLRLWNVIILGVVFFLGFPLTKLFLFLAPKTQNVPRAGSKTYWCAREKPESIEEGIKNQF